MCYDYFLSVEEKTDLENLSNFPEVAQAESDSLQNWAHSLHTVLIYFFFSLKYVYLYITKILIHHL